MGILQVFALEYNMITFFCKRESVSVDKPKDPKGFQFNGKNMDSGIAEVYYRPTPGENP